MAIQGFKDEYRFLSNFWYVKVRNNIDNDGIIYPTVEHAYQAAKTLDITARVYISMLVTPKQAKQETNAYIRKGRIEQRSDWYQINEVIMLELLRFKFLKHPILGRKLRATGDHLLIEMNIWHDNHWGFCTCALCYHQEKQNRLGRLLMRVREELPTNL